MTRGWGWGDYWGALCILVALIASGSLEAGWWVFLVLAAVAGYVGLNVLQGRVDAGERSRVYDQERDR